MLMDYDRCPRCDSSEHLEEIKNTNISNNNNNIKEPSSLGRKTFQKSTKEVTVKNVDPF